MNNFKSRKLPLPISSYAEDLETISRQKLASFFPPDKFEQRSERVRDKGIDLIIEIKENNLYTNFRFVVQLKSTGSIMPNADGSLSIPLEVSNIGYLSNYAMPSYYVLYDIRSDRFFVEETASIKAALLEKYQDANLPKKFTFRFSKFLNEGLVQQMHKEVSDSGIFFKKVNDHLGLLKVNKDSSGILIDGNKDVSSIDENIALISQYGLSLLNGANFDAIIAIEQRSYPRKKVPAIFDLVCGLAYYHKGKLHRALDLLLLASKRKDEFNPELQSSLAYSILQAKYEANVLSKAAYRAACNALMAEAELGSYLQLEQLYSWIQQAEGNNIENFKAFCSKVESVIASETENPRARILGYARILEVGANFLFDDLAKNLNFFAGEGKEKLREMVFSQWKAIQENFVLKMDALVKYIFEHDDVHALGNMSRLKVEWSYRTIYTKHFYEHWSFKSLRSEGTISEERKANILKACKFLDDTAALHETAGDQESIVLNLVLQYELLHAIGENDLIQSITKRAFDIIEENDFEKLKMNFEILLNQGTRHEKLYSQANALLTHLFRIAEKENLVSAVFETPGDEDIARADQNIKWTCPEFINFNFPT